MERIEIRVCADSLGAARPSNGPMRRIQPGELVEVSPLFTNNLNVNVGTTGNAAQYGPYAQIPPGRERTLRMDVRSLSDIFVYGTIGEGVTVTVTPPGQQ